MIEAGADEVDEEIIVQAINFAKDKLNLIVDIQYELQKKVKANLQRIPRQLELKPIDKELLAQVQKLVHGEIEEILKIANKEKRLERTDKLTAELVEKLVSDESEFSEQSIKSALDQLMRQQLRQLVIKKHTRIGGRAFNEIRPIDCKVGMLPRTHGSGMFTRGETQSLSVTTLGSRSDEQMVEALEGELFKNFMLHYSFPPFSVGEIRPIRGPGRREIGHGALAERALSRTMPSKDNFPYTVRVVSEMSLTALPAWPPSVQQHWL